MGLTLESLDSCNAPKRTAMARIASMIRLTCLKPERGFRGRYVGGRMLGRFDLSLRVSTSAISGDLKLGRTPPSHSAKRLRARGISKTESTTLSLFNGTTTGIIYRVVCWPPLPQTIIQESSDCIVAMQKIANEDQLERQLSGTLQKHGYLRHAPSRFSSSTNLVGII